MFDEQADITLGVSRRVRVVRAWVAGARDGRRISVADAAAIADALLRGAAGTFRFRDTIAALCAGDRDPRPALERLLVDRFVMIDLPGTHGRYDGPAVQRPPQRPELPLEPAPSTTRTWVSVAVVDGDEPGRSFAGAQFKLRLPDNSVRADALGDGAGVRVDDIDAGKCWFELTAVPRTPSP